MKPKVVFRSKKPKTRTYAEDPFHREFGIRWNPKFLEYVDSMNRVSAAHRYRPGDYVIHHRHGIVMVKSVEVQSRLEIDRGGGRGKFTAVHNTVTYTFFPMEMANGGRYSLDVYYQERQDLKRYEIRQLPKTRDELKGLLDHYEDLYEKSKQERIDPLTKEQRVHYSLDGDDLKWLYVMRTVLGQWDVHVSKGRTFDNEVNGFAFMDPDIVDVVFGEGGMDLGEPPLTTSKRVVHHAD